MNRREKINILCYGDSNTWGVIPRWKESSVPSERYDEQTRWPRVMASDLGEEFHVAEEGLGGRTTIYASEAEPWKCGAYCLTPCLFTHRPLDLVILMLGTNDLKKEFQPEPERLGEGIERLIDQIRRHPNCGRGQRPPKILILAPTCIMPSSPEGRVLVYPKFNGEKGRALSLAFPKVYQEVARRKGTFFLDASKYARPDEGDGVHFTRDSHILLGHGVADYIRKYIFPSREPRETAQTSEAEEKCSLYMRFEKKLPSAQGMGIYGDHAFILYHTGMCGVYNLKTRCPEPEAFFPLGSYNPGTPSPDHANHANQCMFDELCIGENPIPLLYVTAGSGTGRDEDGYFYRCAVEEIVKEGETYSARTLQVISFLPDGLEETPYESPCWGCPAFYVDRKASALYILSARFRTTKAYLAYRERNAYVITRFRLPQLEEGAFVRLTAKDIREQFTAPFDVLFTQGGTLRNRKIYHTFGAPAGGYPLAMRVYDLEEKRLCAGLDLEDSAMGREEIECCAFYGDKLLCNTNDGGLYVLRDGIVPM